MKLVRECYPCNQSGAAYAVLRAPSVEEAVRVVEPAEAAEVAAKNKKNIVKIAGPEQGGA